MSNARTEVLDRIVAANRSYGSKEAAPRRWDELPRNYSVTGSRSRPDMLALLEDRLHDYDATVVRSKSAHLTDTLNATLTQARVHRIGIPQGLQSFPLPAGFEFVVDRGMSPSELDELDAVLTGCVLAIAETGTLVLQGTQDQGRRALTLVPDVHVCLVQSSDVVDTVPQAFMCLQPTAALPTTFVSGPSATADIEMTRIKGVHGPRFLHVILIDDDAGRQQRES